MLGVGLLKIPVSELLPSVAFYRAALGLEPAFVAEEYGWAQLDGASVAIALYVPGKGDGFRSPGGSVDFHLWTNDIGPLLTLAGAATETADVHQNDDGSRSLEFEDPDGNVLKIMERR
jgi:catechol 2,3-dioxygenase-like lactoylglutathione lyase family enzyme